jgi:hypothetical protein
MKAWLARVSASARLALRLERLPRLQELREVLAVPQLQQE